MPTRPGKTCLTPGCPNVVRDPRASRCRVHDLAYKAEHERARKSSAARGYGGKWAKLRRKFLEVFPTCILCSARATDVDHIIAKRDGGSDDWGNLRSLCHSCHSRRTGREQSTGFIRRG